MADDSAGEIEMRRALERRLKDPRWQARQQQRYSEIVDGNESSNTGFIDIADSYSPSSRQTQFSVNTGQSWLPLPHDEPKTVDDLWIDSWQRSSGALTVTRFPDDTIRIDFANGSCSLYRSEDGPGKQFSWKSETYDARGLRIDIQYSGPTFESSDKAIFDMHRAALATFDELRDDV